MANETKNPIFWSVLAFIVGIGIGIWGLIKEDSDNYVGSGTLLVIAVILIIVGIIGMFAFGGKKRHP